MKDYIRRVCYHETDKMGITHHSNYIKWMEEARIDFLEQVGFGYDVLEERGIISPVIGVECQYLRPTVFNDTVKISVEILEFRGVRLTIGYKMSNAKTQEEVLTGKTMHCFLDKAGKPILLKKHFPDVDKMLKDLAVKEEKE